MFRSLSRPLPRMMSFAHLSLCSLMRFGSGTIIDIENTIGNTPSGNIHDPAVAPKRMVDYRSYKQEIEEEAARKMERDAELQANELRYDGFTTTEIQEMKSHILASTTTTERIAEIIPRLQEILEEVKEYASGDSGIANRRDCHHVRFLLSVACRRVGKFRLGHEYLQDILTEEPWNVDAVEGMLEIYLSSEENIKKHLKVFLDYMTKREREDLAYTILADFVVTAAAEHFEKYGEGRTSVYLLNTMSLLARTVGDAHMKKFLVHLFDNFDELHFTAELSAETTKCPTNKLHSPLQLVVTFLKTLVARNLYQLDDNPLHFEFHCLRKLQIALRTLKRTNESYGICERLIRLYRNNREELADVEDIYRVALFQYVNDRSLDSPAVGKQLCMEAIESYPESAVPWKLLGAVLHREGNLEDALVAAKKSLSLDPNDLSALLMLANLFEATKRITLRDEVMERYKLLVIMQEQLASQEDKDHIMEEALGLEDTVVEKDQYAQEFKEVLDYMEQYRAAHMYGAGGATPLEIPAPIDLNAAAVAAGFQDWSKVPI